MRKFGTPRQWLLFRFIPFYVRKWENFWLNLAFIVPKRLAYWCFVRVFSVATTGKYSSTDCSSITCVDAIKRFGES